MAKDPASSWEKFLHPEALRNNLISAALFISAFEMFRDAVEEKPKTFFSDGFDERGPIINQKYKSEVQSLAKSPFQASLLWLKGMEAFNQDEIDKINEIRRHRNELTHNLVQFVSEHDKNLEINLFESLLQLFSKMEKWWFVSFEAAINPDLLPEGSTLDDVVPGPIWSLQLMLDIALGNEPEEGYYYKNFKEGRT